MVIYKYYINEKYNASALFGCSGLQHPDVVWGNLFRLIDGFDEVMYD